VKANDSSLPLWAWHKNVSHERCCFTTFPNAEKRIENMMHSRVFLTDFKKFGNVAKDCLGCLIYLFRIKEELKTCAQILSP